MEKPCKWCKKSINILQTNDGAWKAFEDASASVAHKCPEYVDFESKISSDDHVLLTQTITRISKLEYSLEGLKNEFVNYKQRQNNIEG